MSALLPLCPSAIVLCALLPLHGFAAPLFEDVTAEAFAGLAGDSAIQWDRESFCVAWTDFDRDGRPDLWVGNHNNTHPPVLYRSAGPGAGQPVFVDAGLWGSGDPSEYPAPPKDDTHGCAWGDLDNDGDPDLIEASGGLRAKPGGHPNHLFLNEGGRLIEVGAVRGVDYPDEQGRQPAWLDWDADGRLDLLVANAGAGGERSLLLLQHPDGRFTHGAWLPSGLFAQLASLTDQVPAEVLLRGLVGFPQAAYAAEDGAYGPVDLTALGLGPPLEHVVDVAAADLNGDQRADFYLSRMKSNTPTFEVYDGTTVLAALCGPEKAGTRGVSFRAESNAPAASVEVRVVERPIGAWKLTPGAIFLGAQRVNPSGVTLTLSGDDPVLEDPQACTPGRDYNRPPGLYVGMHAGCWELTVTGLELDAVVTAPSGLDQVNAVGFDPRDYAVPDLLLRSACAQGRCSYQLDTLADSSAAEGLPAAGGAVVAGDFDNDMDLDLLLTRRTRLRTLATRLLENRSTGGGTVELAATAETGDPVAGCDRCSASGALGFGTRAGVADYDGDGFLDVFISQTGGLGPSAEGLTFTPPRLLRNLGNNNHWLELDLEGVRSTRDAPGARVELTAGGVTQTRLQGGGVHHFAQDHTRLHFGLGSHERAERLVVRWPSGVEQVVEDLPGDQVLRVLEPVCPSPKGKPAYVAGSGGGVYLWQDASGLYRIRLNGDGTRRVCAATLLADRPLPLAKVYSREATDVFSSWANGFTLRGMARSGQDGVSFRLADGSHALLALACEQGGGWVPINPRDLRVGQTGAPLTPAGWVWSYLDLPSVPPETAPLRLARETGGSLRFQVSPRGPGQHRNRALLLTSTRFTGAQGFGLDTGDRLEAGAQSIVLAGSASAEGYGFVASLDGPAPSLVALAYAQDGLSAAHLLHWSPGSRIPDPNAYAIPTSAGCGW